jgi:WD repeat-containing protein 48
MRILDTVRAHPFHPPAPWDAPSVDYPSSTSLLISEESKDAGAWVVTYRSQVSSTEQDMEALEMNSPMWLLDYLFTSRIRIKDPVKLTFILEPAPGSGLKEMPEG